MSGLLLPCLFTRLAFFRSVEVKQRGQDWIQFFGVVFESEVGKVDAVYGAVIFHAVKIDRVHIIEIVGPLGFQLLVVAAVSPVFAGR